MSREEEEPGAERAVPSSPDERADRRRVRRVRWGLLALLGALALGLALLEKPWQLESGAGFASPSGRPLRDTILAATFWAACVNAGLCALLAASAPLWARRSWLPAQRPGYLGSRPPSESRPGSRRRIGWLLLAAALLCLGLRLPLASRSLWWDEAWSIRRVIVGAAAPAPDDPATVRVVRPPWSRPLWDYRKPTNHVLHNTLARPCVDLWRAFRGAEPWRFNELAFRLPSLVAAASSVILLGVLLGRWGFPHAGVAAAFLLALHPWHIRYGAEGRAYSELLFFALVACLALGEALRGGAWRHWLLYAFSQFGLLWSQPTGIYLSLGLGVFALVALVSASWPRRERLTQIMRFSVANLMGAMVFLQVMAPNIAQALAWDDVVQPETRIDATVLRDLWGHLTTGIQAETAPEAEPPEAFPTLEQLMRARRWMGPVVFVLLPALTAVGWVRLLRRRREARWVVVGLCAGVALALAVTWAGRFYYYHRFVVYGLAPVVAGLCVGLEALLDRLPFRRGRCVALVRGAGFAAALVGYAVLVAPQSAVLLSRPIAPMRDAVDSIRADAPGEDGEALRAGLGLGGEMPRVYDPWLRYIDSSAGLEALVAEAERTRRPLYVTYGYPATNRRRYPRAFELLDDPASFTPIADLLGVEAHLHYVVLRYQPSGESVPPR